MASRVGLEPTTPPVRNMVAGRPRSGRPAPCFFQLRRCLFPPQAAAASEPVNSRMRPPKHRAVGQKNLRTAKREGPRFRADPHFWLPVLGSNQRPLRSETWSRAALAAGVPLPVSSSSGAAFSRRRRRQRLSQLTAGCVRRNTGPSAKKTYELPKERAHAFAQTLTFGSPCWARTNDPAVNSRMLYQLS